MTEKGQVFTEWQIQKFSDRAQYLTNQPFETVRFAKNLLLNEGIQELLDLLIAAGGSVTSFARANAYLGVSNSTAAEAATQTELQSTGTHYYVQCSTGYPTRSAQTMTWRAVYSSGTANINWREFSLRNSATTTGRARNLNRKVSNQGTKVAGQTWTLDLSLTVS